MIMRWGCENFYLDKVVHQTHTKQPYVNETQVFTNKGPFDSRKGDYDYELWYYHE